MKKITLREVKQIKIDYHNYIDGGSQVWAKLIKIIDDIYAVTYNQPNSEDFYRIKNKNWNFENDKNVQKILNLSLSQDEIIEIKTILKG